MLFGSCLLWLDCLSHALTYNTFARSFELEERACCDFTTEQSQTRGVVALFSDFFPWFCLVWKHFGWPMRRSRCIEQSLVPSILFPSSFRAFSFLLPTEITRIAKWFTRCTRMSSFVFQIYVSCQRKRFPCANDSTFATRSSRKVSAENPDACFYLFLLYWNFISLSCHRNARILEDASTLNYERIFWLR